MEKPGKHTLNMAVALDMHENMHEKTACKALRPVSMCAYPVRVRSVCVT